jgi:hypothetical protein
VTGYSQEEIEYRTKQAKATRENWQKAVELQKIKKQLADTVVTEEKLAVTLKDLNNKLSLQKTPEKRNLSTST